MTYLGSHNVDLRQSGTYHFKGAVATVKTEEKHRGHADIVVEKVQLVSISAGSIRTLREFYHKFRSGELSPIEAWS